jgi:hypothetical protein
VAGSHPTATCESTRRRALVDGRRSDSTKPVALTCGWWKRLWLVIITLSRERRRAVAGDKGVRGTLVDPASGRTSRLRVVNDTNNVDHPRTWIPIFDGGTHPETTRSSVTEARLRAVKRVRAGAGLPQGGLASRGRSRLTPTKHPVICGGASHGARKSNGPSGARVDGWLQRSVRSIFPPRPRGAERRTEGGGG